MAPWMRGSSPRMTVFFLLRVSVVFFPSLRDSKPRSPISLYLSRQRALQIARCAGGHRHLFGAGDARQAVDAGAQGVRRHALAELEADDVPAGMAPAAVELGVDD